MRFRRVAWWAGTYSSALARGKGWRGLKFSGRSGQYFTQSGSPSHKSHFCTACSGPTWIAPNGQASTQAKQPMQCLGSTTTTPVTPSWKRMACGTGQASLQSGFRARRADARGEGAVRLVMADANRRPVGAEHAGLAHRADQLADAAAGA